MKSPTPLSALAAVLLAVCGSSACGGAAGDANPYPGGAGGQTATGTSIGAGGGLVIGDPLSATEVAAGSSHACALRADGAVLCWGSGVRGQLGDGVSGKDYARAVPALVTNLPAASHLYAGGDTTCAVTASGVFCWGDGTFGQLGDGTAADGHHAPAPVAVPGLEGAQGMSLSGTNACAFLADGTLRCWGRNSAEEWLGFASADCGPFTLTQADGTTTTASLPCETAPRLVAAASDVTLVASGGQHNCLRKGEYGLRCWGADHFGQLGDGASGPDAHHMDPVEVSGVGKVVALGLGTSHTCAAADGRVRCWGDNAFGQLGIGTSALDSYKVTPTDVTTLADITDVHAAGNTTCATSAAQGVLCWGDTRTLLPTPPDPTTGSTVVPTAVPGATALVSVRTGGDHACARTAAGLVICWGSNDRGQLGNGTVGVTDFSMTPVTAPQATPPG
jgi:alpha-tubulin suppressor-like RCC1 family protein